MDVPSKCHGNRYSKRLRQPAKLVIDLSPIFIL
jgi:hypothetical protein